MLGFYISEDLVHHGTLIGVFLWLPHILIHFVHRKQNIFACFLKRRVCNSPLSLFTLAIQKSNLI